MKKLLQILTIAFALSMFTAYLVYSQRQQNQTVMPSSKLRTLDGFTGLALNPTNTNLTAVAAGPVFTNTGTLVAPGSKALVHVISPPVNPPTTATNPDGHLVNLIPSSTTQRGMIAPGSKSAPVFQPAAPAPVEKPASNAPAVPATNAAKSNPH